ncbi:MAG TPA: hypothetical protein VE781_14510 [Kineosporiaceae bacterium]|jgi:hypothetical protein|nr:hypothetical protein [Kineosporiaceae bacterium]
MTYQSTEPVALRGRSRSKLTTAGLATAAAGAVLTLIAPFLPWAAIALPGEKDATNYNGLADEMNGKFTIWLGLVAVVVVAVLAVRAIKGLWVLLPILGLLVTFVSWAQTAKLQNTIDEIASLSSAAAEATKASNGIGVWVSLLGGILLLATAVVVPVTRRRAA